MESFDRYFSAPFRNVTLGFLALLFCGQVFLFSSNINWSQTWSDPYFVLKRVQQTLYSWSAIASVLLLLGRLTWSVLHFFQHLWMWTTVNDFINCTTSMPHEFFKFISRPSEMTSVVSLSHCVVFTKTDKKPWMKNTKQEASPLRLCLPALFNTGIWHTDAMRTER